MQEEVRQAVLKALAIGFFLGGMFAVILYSGVIIPMLHNL